MGQQRISFGRDQNCSKLDKRGVRITGVASGSPGVRTGRCRAQEDQEINFKVGAETGLLTPKQP